MTANIVVAALSFIAAIFLLLEVWIYRRRLFRRAVPAAGILLLSGLANAVCAVLSLP